MFPRSQWVLEKEHLEAPMASVTSFPEPESHRCPRSMGYSLNTEAVFQGTQSTR